jgi:hypothetical protein
MTDPRAFFSTLPADGVLDEHDSHRMIPHLPRDLPVIRPQLAKMADGRGHTHPGPKPKRLLTRLKAAPADEAPELAIAPMACSGLQRRVSAF